MAAGQKSVWEIARFREKYDIKQSDWGGDSGAGSAPLSNIPYRSFIENFVAFNRVSTIIDIGCGDWSFSRFIDFGHAIYLGLDVVEPIVRRNERCFGSLRTAFDMMPNDLSEVPGGDLLIIKDVLQHLSNQKINDFHSKLFKNYKYCLITNSYEKLDTARNIDVPDGEFRCLDLLAPPFCFRGAYVLEFGSSLWERIRTLLVTNTG